MKAKANAASVMQPEIVRAFLAGRSKRMALTTPMHGGTKRHRYSTDGKSLYVWGNEVARRIRGAVYITDAGWRTNLTSNVLNEILDQVGASTRIYSKRKKWRVWNFDNRSEEDWTGHAVIKSGRVRLLPEETSHVTVFGGYTRRSRPRRISLPPEPPRPPEPRMLFNATRHVCEVCRHPTRKTKWYRR
jgi:hypothetical protein